MAHAMLRVRAGGCDMKNHHRVFGWILALGIALPPAVGHASAVESSRAETTADDSPTVHVVFGKMKRKVQNAFSHGAPHVSFHGGRLLPKMHVSRGDKARNAVHRMGIGQSTAKHGGKTAMKTPPGTPKTPPPGKSLAEHRRLQKLDHATSRPHQCKSCGAPTGRPKRRHSM
jgi:hypothetical protein